MQRWASSRQMKFEGGFQGRTNKLVDGCYSFWQGALFPLLQFVFAKTGYFFHYLVICEFLMFLNLINNSTIGSFRAKQRIS